MRPPSMALRSTPRINGVRHHKCISFKKVFRIAAAIAVAVVLGPESSYALFSNAFANAAFAGFASGVIATGSLQGGLQGAITGALFFSTVGLTNPGIERIAAHALVGCATSAASGGNCGAGALAAGFGKFASGALDGIQNEIVRGIIASVIGGTASALGGGKFENGAVTAAFGYLFNTFTEINAAQGRVNAACGNGPTVACSEAKASLRGAWNTTNREQALESSLGPEDAALGVFGVARSVVTNAVPNVLARVIPGEATRSTLGAPGAADVFVTAASDIAGMSARQISQRLTIQESKVFTVIEFSVPASGIASPVFRSNPGFVGFGRTAGGAREFVIPNGPIPADAVIRVVK
jgi:hypothetical protein